MDDESGEVEWPALLRPGVVAMGLVTVGCVVRTTEAENQFWLVALAFLLVAVAVFLLCTGILVLVSGQRYRRKLAKILLALVAGSVCGGLWSLLVDTVVSLAGPDSLNEPAVLVVGVVTALVVAGLLSKAPGLRRMVGLSALVIGFHSLTLPIAALISLFVVGAQWPTAASTRPAFTAVILGIRLAADLRTVGLSVGGLLLGVALVFVGDRVLRRRRMSSSRARFDLSQPHA